MENRKLRCARSNFRQKDVRPHGWNGTLRRLIVYAAHPIAARLLRPRRNLAPLPTYAASHYEPTNLQEFSRTEDQSFASQSLVDAGDARNSSVQHGLEHFPQHAGEN